MLGPTLSLGKISGIPLRLHWSFFLLLIWVAMTQVSIAGDFGVALIGVIFIAAIFGCVVLHELGHCFAARRYGIQTKHITLSPLGGVAALDTSPRNWKEEFWVALAGPAVNVAICTILAPWLLLHPVSVDELVLPTASLNAFVAKLFFANVVMVVFNLLPAFPMDGGRVLRALLEARKDRESATRIAARIGQGFAALFVLAGLSGSFVLMLIGVFIFLAAEGEYRMVQAQNRLKGISVGQMMRTGFQIISNTDSIYDALNIRARTGQEHFPVVTSGKITGILDRPSMLRAASKKDFHASVADYAISDFAMATPGDDLAAVAELMAKTGQMALPVFEAGNLIGIVDDYSIATCRQFPLNDSIVSSTEPPPIYRKF